MINLLPTYSQIINEGEELETVIRLLPKKASFRSIAALNAQLDSNWSQERIFKFYFRRNPQLIHPILNSLKSYFKSTNSKFTLFTELNLNLFLIELVEYGSNDQKKQTTPEEEFLIFKAYLLSIEKYLSKQQTKLELEGESNQDDHIFNNLSWPILVDQFKYTENDFELFHLIRAVVLIDELKKSEYSKYLDAFNTSIKGQAQDYIINLLGIAEQKQILEVNGVRTPSFFVRLSDEIEFLDQLSLDENAKITEKQKVDQLIIRLTPLYKIDNLNYLLLSRRFLKNKIYTGFIFDFYHRSGIKKEIKTFPDFKSYLGKQINEERIFQPLLQTIFQINENKLFFIEKDGYPDGYLRIDNRIFLFEFKDYLFGIKPVTSEMYIDFKNEIENKFIKNERGDPKGITQLANQIKFLTKSTFDYDDFINDNIKRERIEIYPLIVYTDYMYSIPGINSYLKLKFNELKPEHNFKEIFQPVMIDLKFFFNNLPKIQATRFDKILKKYKYQIIKNQKKFEQSATPQNWMNANNSISHIYMGNTFKNSNKMDIIDKLKGALKIDL